MSLIPRREFKSGIACGQCPVEVNQVVKKGTRQTFVTLLPLPAHSENYPPATVHSVQAIPSYGFHFHH